MKIHELLTDESKWTQHAWARDAQGNSVWPDDPNAVGTPQAVTTILLPEDY